MKKKSIFRIYIELFITFFKIGLLTFGGGYAMIPLIEKDAGEKRKWISSSELLDIIAISESTPGPISINAATYIGFKVGKVLGSVFATLGLVLPSFLIILLISTSYKFFIQLDFINAIFKGLRIGVIVLLFNAFIKLSKSFKRNFFSIILFGLVLTINIVFAFLNIKFNYTSIIMILSGLFLGVISLNFKRRQK